MNYLQFMSFAYYKIRFHTRKRIIRLIYLIYSGISIFLLNWSTRTMHEQYLLFGTVHTTL